MYSGAKVVILEVSVQDTGILCTVVLGWVILEVSGKKRILELLCIKRC